jgi:hypothetical protein
MVTRTRQKVFVLRIFPVLSAFRNVLNIATASSMTSHCRPLSFVYYAHCFLHMTLSTYFYTSSGKCLFTFRWRCFVNERALVSDWEGFFFVILIRSRSAADRKIHGQENPLPPNMRDSTLMRTSLKALGIWYQSRDDKWLIIKWLTPSFCLCRKHSSAYIIGICCGVT